MGLCGPLQLHAWLSSHTLLVSSGYVWDESSPSRGFRSKKAVTIRMDGIECCGKAEARVPKTKK